MELIFLFFKILIVLLAIEGLVYGVVLVIMMKCISISHKVDEEREANGQKNIESVQIVEERDSKD